LEIGGRRVAGPALAWLLRLVVALSRGPRRVLEFRILGSLEAVDQGRPLVLGGPRQRALLAILLLHHGEVVSSDRLIDELWGERPPATAAKTLQGYV
jgi:DNA-binding response OmpR family regulator